MLLAGICKIQIFNSFHLSMIKFRNLSSHMRGTIRWPLHLDDCACGQKSSCTNQYPIAPRATRHRPVQKIISEMSFNLITNFSPCVVGCAPALTALILAKPRIRVPQDFSGPLPTKAVPTTLEQSTGYKVSLFVHSYAWSWSIFFIVQSDLAITRVEGGRILKQKTAL